MVASSRMSIHRNVMDRLTLPGGDVHGYTRRLTQDIEIEAKVLAPYRTGALQRSIEATARGSNASSCNFRVSAGVAYAQYVVRFTAGRPATGTWGPYGSPDGGHIYRLYAQRPGSWGVKTQYAGYQYAGVRGFEGYDANDFLTRALRNVARTHQLI